MDPEERENLIALLQQRNEEAIREAYQDLDDEFDMDSLHPSVPTVGLSTPAQLTAKIPQGGLNNIKRTDNNNNNNEANEDNTDNTEKKKKKKKKKKSKTSKLPEAGSELTEDYKENYEEDAVEDPYDPSRPIARRIEYAIWKYKRNHRFTEENRGIFDDYLKFGGVTVSPNMFLGRATGADSANAEKDVEMDFEAAKAATATIDDDEEEALEDGVYISFSEVVQVYLGNHFMSPEHGLYITLANHQMAPKLIDAFLRYLEIRNVAPEYKEDIAKARSIVQQAQKELVPCKMVKNELPGVFNKACQTLFDGKYTTSNNNDDGDDDSNAWLKGITDPMTKQFVAELTSTNGKENTIKVKEAKEVVSRVLRIKQQDIDNLILKKENHRIWAKIKDIQPCEERNPTHCYYKVTLVRYDRRNDVTLNNELYDLYVEEVIQKHLMLGNVVHFILNQLSNDQWYLTTSYGVYPTFYKWDQFDENDIVE